MTAVITLAAVAGVISATASHADEGGVSFWIPGQFGSLAAAPGVPGWAVGIINLYNPVSGSGNVSAAREVTLTRFSTTVNVNLNATLKANPDLTLVAPTYVFATPVFGGQFASRGKARSETDAMVSATSIRKPACAGTAASTIS